MFSYPCITMKSTGICCGLLDYDTVREYQGFRVQHCLHGESDYMFPLNFGTHLPDYTVSQPRKSHYVTSSPWRPQVLIHPLVSDGFTLLQQWEYKFLNTLLHQKFVGGSIQNFTGSLEDYVQSIFVS
jgi:hypothetical protein